MDVSEGILISHWRGLVWCSVGRAEELGYCLPGTRHRTRPGLLPRLSTAHRLMARKLQMQHLSFGINPRIRLRALAAPF